MFAKWMGVAIASAALLAGAGCREEGPAEKMGRQLDEAVEGAAEQVEESAEELKKKMTEE